MGLLADFFHMAIEEADIEASILESGAWIRHVHLKDAVLTKKPGTWGTEVPWGDGEVDAPRFLAELKAAGYKGNFAIEREGGNDRTGDIALAASRLLNG